MNTITVTGGRGWAYASAILGGSISIAANVAHSFIHPTGAPADWHPETGAVLSAIAWPVVLFFAVETLARTPWPKKAGYHLLKWLGLPPVAFVAALVSYRHLSGLLAHYGEDYIVVVLGPIAIDGLMLMATGALIATSPRNRTHPVHHDDQAVTVTTTPTHATRIPAITPTPVSRIAPATPGSPAVPAVKKAPAKKATPRKAPAKATPVTMPAKASTPTRSAVATLSTEQANLSASRHTVPPAPMQAPAPTAQDSSVTVAAAAPPPKAPAPAALLTRARHLADAHLKATSEPITKGTLAARLGVNTDTAEQLLAVLGLDANRPTTAPVKVNGAAVADLTR